MRSAIVGAFALIFVCSSLVPRAQRLTCAPGQCEIILEKVVSLSDRGHPGIIPGPSPFVVQDRLGRYFLHASNLQQIIVFDRTGRITSLLGESKEFVRGVSALAAPRQRVAIYNQARRQVRFLDDDLNAKTAPVSLAYAPALIRDDGTMIVAQQIRTPELIGYPLHLLSPTGEVLRSFGAANPEYRPDLRLLVERVVAPGPADTIWAMPPGRYVLERWNPQTGQRLSTTAVKSSWFVESSSLPTNNRVRPTPIISGLWERDGMIWVLVRDADSKWQPPSGDSNVERGWELGSYNATHDWVLEVIDSATGVPVATKRFDTARWGRSPQPFVVSHGTSKPGEPKFVDIWIPQLRRR